MSLDFALPEGSGAYSSSLGYDLLLLYLSWIDTSPIVSTLHDLFPSDTIKRWVYSPLSLLKLAILQDKKKLVTVPWFRLLL